MSDDPQLRQLLFLAPSNASEKVEQFRAICAAAAHRSSLEFLHFDNDALGETVIAKVVCTVTEARFSDSLFVTELAPTTDGPGLAWHFASSNGFETDVVYGQTYPTDALQDIVSHWLRQDWPVTTVVDIGLPGAVEAFYFAWQRFASEAPLNLDDRLVGDALATMANDLAKSEAPPHGPLRAAFDWFAHKADVFADAAAKAGGAAVGTTLGVGIGATASGQLPHLLKAIETVRTLL